MCLKSKGGRLGCGRGSSENKAWFQLPLKWEVVVGQVARSWLPHLSLPSTVCRGQRRRFFCLSRALQRHPAEPHGSRRKITTFGEAWERSVKPVRILASGAPGVLAANPSVVCVTPALILFINPLEAP